MRESTEGAHELVEMRWGLVPHWSKEPKAPASTFSARAETVGREAQPGVPDPGVGFPQMEDRGWP
jgi:putative SOS response-associated peptidase YedK